MSRKRFAAAALTLCVLVAGVKTAGTQTPSEADAETRASFARKKPLYDPGVGKTFWITGHVDICPDPNALMPQCARIQAPRRLSSIASYKDFFDPRTTAGPLPIPNRIAMSR